MWKSLYDSFLQLMTMPWAKFIQDNKSCGRVVRDSFQNKIYGSIGLYAIVITLVFSVFYYYYLNAKFGRYYSLKSWFLTLLLTSILVGLATFFGARDTLDSPICDVSMHLLWISIINAVYAGVLFLAISIVIKWKSPMGKRTPL